jgi:hypothetical protein
MAGHFRSRRAVGTAAALGAVLAVSIATGSVCAQPDHDAGRCDEQGARAETAFALPAGLLNAIGLVESGRADPESGRVRPWPWSLNARGEDHTFNSLPEAAAAVRALQKSGVASIDVGCFQVNLMHHPNAFATIEEAFDPAANATYAARFLRELRARTGSWEAAIAAYHSATPTLGEPYRSRVEAAWAGHALAAADAVAVGSAAPRIRPEVIAIAGVAMAPVTVAVWTPSAPGSAPARIAIAEAPQPGGHGPQVIVP